MALEECKRCNKGFTPWLWVEELGGHVCFDCSFHFRDLDRTAKKDQKKACDEDR